MEIPSFIQLVHMGVSFSNAPFLGGFKRKPEGQTQFFGSPYSETSLYGCFSKSGTPRGRGCPFGVSVKNHPTRVPYFETHPYARLNIWQPPLTPVPDSFFSGFMVSARREAMSSSKTCHVLALVHPKVSEQSALCIEKMVEDFWTTYTFNAQNAPKEGIALTNRTPQGYYFLSSYFHESVVSNIHEQGVSGACLEGLGCTLVFKLHLGEGPLSVHK